MATGDRSEQLGRPGNYAAGAARTVLICVVCAASVAMAEHAAGFEFEDPIDEVRQQIAEQQAGRLSPYPIGRPELFLAAVSFFVSTWSTAVGTCGALSFAAMATILPPGAVVPIHAVTVSAATFLRTWAFAAYVDWRFVWSFMLGGLAGFALGVPLLCLDLLSPDALRIVLGLFILAVTWVPFANLGLKIGSFAKTGGTVTSAMTLFVGATTPMVAALIGQSHEDHRRVLGTLNACMSFQHSAKIAIFGLIGFSFGQYLDLLILLIAASAIGTIVGKRILLNIPQSVVKPIFKLVLTALGFNMIRVGLPV